MYKRSLSLFLAFLLLLSLSGCYTESTLESAKITAYNAGYEEGYAESKAEWYDAG